MNKIKDLWFWLGCLCAFFNAFDAIATVLLLQAGFTELNPVMSALINLDNRLFLLFKFILSAIMLYCIKYRNKSETRMAIGVTFGVYSILFVYQVICLVILSIYS